MHSHTRGHVQEMGVVTDAGHSKVEVRCHQRRGSGNWRPHISSGPVEIGTILVKSNLASHIESHKVFILLAHSHFWEFIPR